LIPEIDIWRAALLMIKRHGEKALDESAARADELALAGDDDGATTWRRIKAAVTESREQDPARPGQLVALVVWPLCTGLQTFPPLLRNGKVRPKAVVEPCRQVGRGRHRELPVVGYGSTIRPNQG
jgi:hypothetical protein